MGHFKCDCPRLKNGHAAKSVITGSVEASFVVGGSQDKNVKLKWLVDSGASRNMTSRKDLFQVPL